MATTLEDIERKLERVLFGQAQISLRVQSEDPKEKPSYAAIKEEYERLREDFLQRHSDDPPREGGDLSFLMVV